MKRVLKPKAEKATKMPARQRQAAAAIDEMLDEALSETFPASDAVALTQPSRRRRAQLQRQHPSRRISSRRI